MVYMLLEVVKSYLKTVKDIVLDMDTIIYMVVKLIFVLVHSILDMYIMLLVVK